MATGKSVSRRAEKKQILIVDDHPMMQEGLRGVINREADLTVCAEAGSAEQAVQIVDHLVPDLALVDITLPGRSGLELVKDLKASHPTLPILAISMHDESLYAERMLRAGANGYISKQQPPGELVKAIRQVLAGQVYVSRQVSDSLLRRFSSQPQACAPPTTILTDREFEIMQLFGKGLGAGEIARQLHLSAKTVAVHAANIRQKLKVRTTAQLIRYAVQWEDLKSLAND